MRLLYIDIDSLRPDHLGCYGYHRQTSPNIDVLAQEAVRFTNVYISDAPCLPSRTALWSGRTGFHTGVVDHGGIASQPFIEAQRGNDDLFSGSGWMRALNDLGMKTVTVSPFAQRHAAWHWYASFHEIYNTGKGGNERADEVVPVALDWLERSGRADNWFLHVNRWDPHTPFRTPLDYGEPFADAPIPAWLTEVVWRRGWEGYGPHSPQEISAWFDQNLDPFPREPNQIDSMEAVRQWVNGYDTGIHYADFWVGKLLDKLRELGIYDETIIVVGADHGENIGELNVWGDHQTADHITCNVPLIIRYPGEGAAPRVDTALHYHFDWAATVIELLGGVVPAGWDGQSFADAFRRGEEAGREYLITSQGAWSVQRGVRFNHDGEAYMYLRTLHDGYKALEPEMLFNLTHDPHEQQNLAAEQRFPVLIARALLATWYSQQTVHSAHDIDPLMTVLRQGGGFYTRGRLPAYLKRLRETGRAHHAEALAARHADEI